MELFGIFVKFRLHLSALLIVLCMDSPFSKCEKVKMKIIEDAANSGASYPYQEQTSSLYQLKMRVQPSNFSGPPQFERLTGRCFDKVDESPYKYELCMFSNVTQHEQSLRWNPYSGVLGVWQEWEIENNTFVAIHFTDGDSCGSIFRSVRVIFECGKSHELDEVSEPKTCQYQLVFRTPLVCHQHAMLVYPTLSESLQHKWNLIEGELLNEEITQQGYKNRLKHLFEEAGYLLPQNVKEENAKQALAQHTSEAEESDDFDSLLTCSQKYKKLKEELEAMKTLLAVYQGTNATKGKALDDFNIPGHAWLPGEDDHDGDADHHMWDSEEFDDDL